METVINSKTIWLSPNEEQYDSLQNMLSARLKEGNGETLLVIGTGEGDEDGLTEEEISASEATVKSIQLNLNFDMILLRKKQVGGKFVHEYLLRERIKREDFMEVRVAVIGNVDSGKSTLLGVLSHGILDDGRGHARLKLFRHKHERETGRTSSVGNDILGFDNKGNVVNKADGRGFIQEWAEICRQSAKIVTFIDLAGHEKYLKTTVFGLTGYAPDYCMLMIGSNMGIVGMTKEHLGLALALSVPVFVIITKIDICPKNVLNETTKLLSRLLKSPGCRKLPIFVHSEDDVIMCASNFTSERLCPVFQVSNVTGENLNLVQMFLNLLNVRKVGSETEPAEFQIDDLYTVPGVGTVVSGTMMNGRIDVNDTLIIGPDGTGEFKPVQIKSIHRKRLPVDYCVCGQTASFALKKVKKSELRKGMVILAYDSSASAYSEFEADVLILHHPTTISVKYQAMVHVGAVRQTASIIKMSVDCLRTGDRAIVRFRFLKTAEYIRVGQKLVFREGRTKAIGTVTNVFETKHSLTTPKIKSSRIAQDVGKKCKDTHHKRGTRRKKLT